MSAAVFPPPVARALTAVAGPGSGGGPDGDAVRLAQPWPGRIWAAGSHWVWAAPPGSGRAPAEAVGLARLGPYLPVPEVVLVHADWLVTTAPAGEPATRPERQPRPDDVPAAIGAALRRLHDLDPTTILTPPVLRSLTSAERSSRSSESPDLTVGAVVGRIEAALGAGDVDTDALPDPYRRYDAAQLAELVAQGAERSAAAAERAGDAEVVVHGDPVVGNWFLAGGELASVTGLHRLGRADRHLDVAIAYRSIHDHFGPEAVFGFIEGYGRDPDLVRLDHHLLLSVLLDRLDPPAELPVDGADEVADEPGSAG